VRDLRGPGLLRAIVAGLLIGTALLTGCSQKTEANDTLPPTSSAPTTEALPSVGPADFPVPDEARTQDTAGAEAFLRYFIELLNRQQKIPAGQPLRELGPECQECLRIALDLDEAAAAQQQYQGGELSIVGDFGTSVSDGSANVSFVARIAAGAIVDASRAIVPGTEFDTVERLPSAVRLAWDPDAESWEIEAVNFG
jgi:hypothetical protein